MEKRVLLAVTLSIIVILVYPMILAKINPDLVSPAQKPQLVKKQVVVEKNIDIKTKETELVNELPLNALTESLYTDRYSLDITDKGGAITRILIKDSKRKNDIPLVGSCSCAVHIEIEPDAGELIGVSAHVIFRSEKTDFFGA